MDNPLIPFEGDRIRKEWYNKQWYFSIIDIIEILTNTDRPRKYWSDLKKKIGTEGFNETSENFGQLKMLASDGKNRLTDCANTEGVLRIVMAVPSPKAEPLKLWLAQVGRERIEETENPELSFERMMEIYKAKGYSDEWITRRVESIKARKRLTDEWKNRGIADNKDFSILTATIAKGTFGLTPSEHKEHKGLTKPSQELRDHMTPIELILTALGEETTRMIAVKQDAQGFNENHDAATKGGKTAGEARERVEAVTGQKVVSKENYLNISKKNTEELPDNTAK
jgi:DNA-damage-inducible protein D